MAMVTDVLVLDIDDGPNHASGALVGKVPSAFVSRAPRLTSIDGMHLPCKRTQNGTAIYANPSFATYGGKSTSERHESHTLTRTVEPRMKPFNHLQINQIACGKEMMPVILPFVKWVLFRSMVTGAIADRDSPVLCISANYTLGVYVLHIEKVSIVFRFLIHAMGECVKNDVEQRKYDLYRESMFTIFTLVEEAKTLDVAQRKLYTSFKAMLQTAGLQPEMLSCCQGANARNEGKSMRGSKKASWVIQTRWHLTMEFVDGPEGVLKECSYSSFFDLDIANFPVGLAEPNTNEYKSPFHKVYVDIYTKTAPRMYADMR
jgi:hypothetical protein